MAARGRAVTAAAAATSSRSAGDATARTTQVAPRRTGPYTVQPGDCLWSIARRVLAAGASDAAVAAEVDRLWRLNAGAIGTGSPDLIEPGQVLRLR
jgi:nucleoid-associated protein YgaU